MVKSTVEEHLRCAKGYINNDDLESAVEEIIVAIKRLDERLAKESP